MSRTAHTIAIHQPNFFPWLGFFHKMAAADLLLLMDNAQLPKTGGSWVNRVRIMQNGQPRWVSVPIRRPHGRTIRIDEVEIDGTLPWQTKLVRSLEQSYARAAYYDDVMPLLKPLIEYRCERLALYNANIIRRLAEILEIRTRLEWGSSTEATGSATDLLVAMVKAVDGDSYLSGAGAAAYQEDEKFADANISLARQEFRHPVYQQQSELPFVAGLSIVDVLFNCGVDVTRGFVLGLQREAAMARVRAR